MPEPGDLTEALEVAIEAVRAAADVLRGERQRNGETVAEHAIRERLCGAFPRFGYTGEETGSVVAADGETRHWLVDPLDGTSGWMSRLRGPATSIALLDNGEPVLGVVFAFEAPDEDGDLYAWARGCGPLVRNREPVTAVDAPPVVWLNLDPEDDPEPYARWLRPYRFRTAPSIAWRLARVAAGDGVCAMSLHRPRPLDYAAGHALLLATGQVLLDAEARPVRYGVDGSGYRGAVFGGTPEAARELAERWRSQGPPPSGSGDSRLTVWPVVQPLVASDQERAQAAMVGYLLGDAAATLVARRPAGTWSMLYGRHFELRSGGTFDTLRGQPGGGGEQAIGAARSILHGDAADWPASRPFQKAEESSAHATLLPELLSTVTSRPTTDEACILMAALRGEDPPEVHSALAATAREAWQSGRTWEDAVVDTLDREPLSAAYIAAVMGAVRGLRNLPKHDVAAVLSCRPLRGLVEVQRPRPREWWPIDALALAEGLLSIGLAAK